MTARKRQPEESYEEHFSWLVDLAVQRGVSRAEAESLAQDVLTAAITQRPKIADLKTWLTGALSSALTKPGNPR